VNWSIGRNDCDPTFVSDKNGLVETLYGTLETTQLNQSQYHATDEPM